MHAWGHFLTGKEPEILDVVESSEAARGTYEDLVMRYPSDKVDHDEL